MHEKRQTKPNRVTIERAKGGNEHKRGGGYIIEHSYDNSMSGESYRQPEKHVATSLKDLQSHIATHMGDGDEGNGGANAGKPSGDAKPKPKPQLGAGKLAKAPGPKTRGAGVD